MKLHPMAFNMNTRVRWAAVERELRTIEVTGKRVLDVGCGLGFFCAQFKARGALVDGVDIDRGAVEYVQRELGIPAQIVDIEREILPRRDYDLIFIGEVLEHVKQPADVYAKIREALKPGGVLILTTPALEGWLSHSRGKQLAHDHGGQKHEREGYWKAELDSLARDAGLTLVRHEYCLYTVAELFMQATKLGYLLSRRDYEGQSDVLSLVNKPSFKVLRLVFPLVWALAGLEATVARPLGLRGHCHVQVAQRI